MTKNQRKIYDFIVKQINKNKEAPTQREIQEKFGYKSCNSVEQYLDVLERDGYIRRTVGLPRGIQVCEGMK